MAPPGDKMRSCDPDRAVDADEILPTASRSSDSWMVMVVSARMPSKSPRSILRFECDLQRDSTHSSAGPALLNLSLASPSAEMCTMCRDGLLLLLLNLAALGLRNAAVVELPLRRAEV